MTSIGASHGSRPRWAMRAMAAVVVAGSLAVVATDVSAAQAVPATTKLQVVKVVTRHPFGKMLATVKGRSLYTIASNKCTGACLPAWPPLLMPKGSKATPTGTSCLTTMKFGKGRRQVAYRGLRLWLFAGDKGTSVSGNNIMKFKVAKVHTGACPLQVVQVVSGRGFGKMLATVPGMSLYYQPTLTCNAACQAAWPPLTMPKGSTDVPTGTTCLSTKALGSLRQVTYRGHLLYTFTGDSGSSASGNGLAGFVVAKVTTGAC